MNLNNQKLLEELSALEHEQWMSWAKHILNTEDISQRTRKRWEQNFISYDELPENVKQLDRLFAQKSLEILKKYLEENK